MFLVNLTLNACSFIIMLIIFFSIIFGTSGHGKRKKILLTIVITITLGILINSFSNIYSHFYSNPLIPKIFQILAILSIHIWVILLFCYVESFLKEKNVSSWKVIQITTIYILSTFFVYLIVTITINVLDIKVNNFSTLIFNALPGINFLFICILYFVILIKYRLELGNSFFAALLINMIIPGIAFILDTLIKPLEAVYFAEAISVVVCSIIIQYQEIQDNNVKLKVTNSELEDHIHQVIKLNNSLNEQMNIIHSLEKVYFSTYYIDLINDSFEEISSKNNIRSTIGTIGRAQESLFLMSERLVIPEYSAKMREFVDLSTVNDRLKNKDFITFDYIGVSSGWSQIYLIAGDRDQTGNLLHIFSATRIIHEEKEREFEQNKALEEALAAAKSANNAKTAFLSRMSHDIRTPLNGIIGLIEINERHPEDRVLHEQNRVKAKVSAHHLLSLINDVLELTKMDDDNVKLANEAFSISDLTQEVLTIASLRATEAGISIENSDYQNEIKEEYVFGSPLHVRQILLNICGNAIKYNKPHGKITFEIKWLEQDEENVKYQISISDTGIGMSPEFVEHIYEPFSQEHSDARSVFQGTGLGMSIVKILMEKMNGEIKIQSKVDEGTRFDLIIPFKIAKKEDVVAKVTADKVDISGVRILLVEDNELNMEIAETILVDSGAVVTKAFNGQEAVDIYRNNPSASFDLILMDLMMPVLDGFGATAAIRSSNKRDAKLIPIIAMTANAFTEDAKKCLDAGMNAHVAKPIIINELFNKIAIVMAR